MDNASENAQAVPQVDKSSNRHTHDECQVARVPQKVLSPVKFGASDCEKISQKLLKTSFGKRLDKVGVRLVYLSLSVTGKYENPSDTQPEVVSKIEMQVATKSCEAV